MNTCEKIQVELEAFRTGELLPAEASVIEKHLRDCMACAKEAALLDAFGARIGNGLKGWAAGGTVPPMLAAQIEASIRAEARSRRSLWPRMSRWGVPAGVAAAAVLLVAVTYVIKAEMGPLAAAGGIGGLIETFLGRPVESVRNPEPGPRSIQSITLTRSATVHGVTVRVEQVDYYSDHTKVEYRVRGDRLLLDDASHAPLLEPVLSGPAGPVPFRNMSVQRTGDSYLFQAYFDPVDPKAALALEIDSLPRTERGGPRWDVAENRAEKPTAAFGGEEVAISSWQQNGNQAAVTVEWGARHIVRFTEWTARDAAGKLYPVKESGISEAGGRRTQTLIVEVPENVPITLEAGGHDIVQTGPWQVTFGG